MSNPEPASRDAFDFERLRSVEGIQELDRRFLAYVDAADRRLGQRLRDYRQSTEPWPALETSTLILDLAPHLEAFLARLFAIEAEVARLRAETTAHDPVLAFKREFVQQRARRYRASIEASFDELDHWLDAQLAGDASVREDREGAVARYALGLLDDADANADAIERVTQWCALALRDAHAGARVSGWVSFRLPQRRDHARLVPLHEVAGDPAGRLQAAPEQWRRRDGFRLTDPRMNAREVQSEVHYCVYCHGHEGDFCSRGFPEKKGEPAHGLKKDPLGVVLTGCPLEEKISEMHQLKRDGYSIAALAVAMVDNPMVPATGHRICNDCMKACIYQKQDPVNIPQIETRVLTDVLHLPWGVEIYDLLTRWNPLRQRQALPKPYNGRKVLIAGMGPAGFTMAHHLTMEGCAVVGIDGLKIEPLPERFLREPVRDYRELEEPLDERILAGFGGVAEYGITVRWDKNFLKLIYLTLARRPLFQVFGGVRLGGTIRLEDAWALGFDHVCIATGAGLPRVLAMGNSLARGMRQASDFLMALQLTGAAKASSIASLQVRLPSVVIGGGLTGIDTATEVQAYYIAQVEHTLQRYETLVAQDGEEAVRAGLDEEHLAILDEFLEHGRAVRAERERAARAGEPPDFIPLLRAWGGVTVAYRRSINESPAYIRNHEEIIKAMEEGIYYAEGLEPLRAECDRYGHVEALVCRRRKRDGGRWLDTFVEARLPARSIFVAAGAVPNTIYEKEYPGTFQLEGNHFLPHVVSHNHLQPVKVAEHCKEKEFGPFTSYEHDGRRVSFLGDTNPVFHGSVVKAIASSARSYPQVMAALHALPETRADVKAYHGFREEVERLLAPRVAEVRAVAPQAVEVWVEAPQAARNFRPGQFFRLQTFEQGAPMAAGTRLQIPLQTVSGAGIDGERVRLVVLQFGGASRLAGRLRAGERIVLMGPTGAPAHIPHGKTVLVLAGSWGAAVMLDLGPALRRAGNRVLYFASFTDAGAVYHQDLLEQGADQIVWCCAREPLIEARRPQDVSVQGTDLVELVAEYGAGRLQAPGAPAIGLEQVEQILVMGSTGLLRGVRAALAERLRAWLSPEVEALGTVGSPMQCMLKGVCAQCVQWQIDPATGERTRAVFACAQQDQPLQWIDLDNLAARQRQNRLTDYLTARWVDYVLEQMAASDRLSGTQS